MTVETVDALAARCASVRVVARFCAVSAIALTVSLLRAGSRT
jgi:hypothetical protein